MTPRFQLKNAMLLMALAAAYPLQAQAAAGVAQFAVGDVTLRRGSGADPLIKGRNLESGDAITTGPNGRAQIRFSDGGLVALQPNSEFNITRYADAGDAKQDGFFVDLLRGGMRAVTGLIGKRNHDNYRVTTQTATVGIRGSAFNIAYNSDGTLSVATEMDEIVVCTQGGCVGLTAGEAVRVTSNAEVPARVNERSTMQTPAPRQDPQVAGNQAAPDGESAIVPANAPTPPRPPVTPRPPPAPRPPPPSPNPPSPATTAVPGLALAIVGNKTPTGDAPSADQRNYANGTLVLDAQGNPQQYTSSTNVTGTRVGASALVATRGTVAGGDYMALGTLEGVNWKDGSATTAVGLSAFATGFATASSVLNNQTIKGQRGSYTMTNATPVFSSGGYTGTLQSATLDVDFLGTGSYVNAMFNIQFPGGVFGAGKGTEFSQVATEGGTNYILTGNGTGTGSGFAGALSTYSSNCAYGYSVCGGGSFSGFFGGAAGTSAGVSFSASSTDHGYFGGAALLAQQGARTATPTASYTGTPENPAIVRAMFIDGAVKNTTGTLISPTAFYGNNAIGSVEFKFTGAQLTGWSSTGDPGHMADSVSLYNSGSSFGAFGNLQTGSDFIGWGTWAAARTGFSGYGAYGGQGSTSQLLDTVHYIVGKPTSAVEMPMSGTGSYTLLAGSAPTLTSYSSTSGLTTTITGQLLPTSNLVVNFGGEASVTANINTQFPNQPVNQISAQAYINGSTFSGGNTDTGTINGMFSGSQAYRAGLVYGLGYPTNGTGHITGAAVFQRTGSPTPQ